MKTKMVFKKGQKAWNKGIHPSEDTILKMIKLRKNKNWEEIFGVEKAKIMREKMSERQKIKPYASFRDFNDKTKKQMSESAKKRISEDCINCFKSGKENLWYKMSTESKIKHSEKRRKWCLDNSDILRERIRKTHDKYPEMCYQFIKNKDISKQQNIMRKLLPNDFIMDKRFCGSIPDFRSEKRKIIVEVDGVYRHSSNKAVQRDQRHNKEYKKQGYTVFRIPHTDVDKYFKPMIRGD